MVLITDATLDDRTVHNPKGCGTTVTRRQFRDHQTVYCPHTIVSCRFSSYGCTQSRVARSMMMQHVRDNAHMHAELVLSGLETLTAVVDVCMICLTDCIVLMLTYRSVLCV